VAVATLGCAHPSTTPVPFPPRLTYDSAVALVAQRQARDDSVAARGGRSILLTHGAQTPRIFVLMHGFSDSPTQFSTVGEHLFTTGDNVFIPRLPHHAERVAPLRALGLVRAPELAGFGDSIVDAARGLGDTIIVAGLSAGGAIAAHLAQTRADVYRAVLIAPAIGAGTISEDSERAIVLAATHLPNIERSSAPDTTRPDNVQGYTTRGLAEVIALGQSVRARAEHDPARAGEVVFLLNELDHTVSEELSVQLAEHWFDRGAKVVIYRFPNSAKLPHNVMEASERGGNLAIVLPVVEALVRGDTVLTTAERRREPCGGFWCQLRRLTRKKS
jgi:esterase/lipase